MIRTLALLVCFLAIVVSAASYRPVSAVCTPTPPNLICDNANDLYTVTSDSYTNRVDGGSGMDTLTIAASAEVGDSSTSALDGLFGGLGADSLTNNGTIMGLDGITDGDYTNGPNDGASDTIISTGLIIANSTGIEGGDGDILGNGGTIISAFTGIQCFGAVGCYASNTGSISAVVGLQGGSGADTFNNYGTITSSIDGFTGDDIISNISGQVSGAIMGGEGNDTLRNYARVTNVTGGTGADSIYNYSASTIGGFINAGDGNDSVRNLGSIGGTVTLGNDADYLISAGAGTATSQQARISGAVYGDAGNDTIINSLNSYIDGIDGGIGNDSIRNHSIVAGAINGGEGNDNLTNFAGALANQMSGGSGADSVSNGGAFNYFIDGNAGQDTVTNFAGALASYVNGGPDNDRVINGGFINAILMGETGNDSVVNLAGAFVADVYGDAGMDTVINGGFVNATVWGGDDNDRVVNLGGAQATNISGDFGNDSVFNGGYLVGQLYGGFGDDTVVNAAFSYSAGANLGDGNDQFVNGGYLNGPLDCGAGSDSVSLGGFVNAGVNCADGSDFVSILNGVVAGQGAGVTGVIDGGAGIDGLVFNFTVTVPSQAAADAIAAAITAASPAGGTVTIGQVTYAWINFEALYNLLAYNINEPVTITIPVTRRVNQSDAAAPVAVYCAEAGVELWMIGADGAGSFGFSVPYTDVSAGTTVSAQGVTFTASGDESFSISATASDGKPYTFTGSCS